MSDEYYHHNAESLGNFFILDHSSQSNDGEMTQCSNWCQNVQPEELYKHCLDSATALSGIVALPLAETLCILKHYMFDISKAQVDYFEEDNNKTLREKYFLWDSSDEAYAANYAPGIIMPLCKNKEPIDCNYCALDMDVDKGFSLCKIHFFCKECWIKKLLYMIKDSSMFNIVLRCDPSSKPNCRAMTLVSELDIAELRSIRVHYESERSSSASYTLNEIMRQYYLLWARNFAIRCSTLDCKGLFAIIDIVCGKPKINKGICIFCNHMTCLICGNPDHLPASCQNMNNWLLLEHKESMNAVWIKINTKNCPMCCVSIEKNKGCNHMVCSAPNCKFEFCWVCMGSWSEHNGSNYDCNKPKPSQDPNINILKHSCVKYVHYWDRYQNHGRSKILDCQTVKEVRNFINSYTKADISYLEEAAKTLYECRSALQHTYVYAFYADVEKICIFEYEQGQLEAAVEKLSEIVNCHLHQKTMLDNLRERTRTITASCKHWLSVLLKYGD